LNTVSYPTVSAKQATVEKNWKLIDADSEIVGRLAVVAARLLRGKHKPSFTPHVDCGDHVIIVNADKVRFTGSKFTEREYQEYSGYPGGQKRFTPREVMAKRPRYVVEEAIRGMLPKNRLGREIFRNLHVYAGPAHLHQAQQPVTFEMEIRYANKTKP